MSFVVASNPYAIFICTMNTNVFWKTDPTVLRSKKVCNNAIGMQWLIDEQLIHRDLLWQWRKGSYRRRIRLLFQFHIKFIASPGWLTSSKAKSPL